MSRTRSVHYFNPTTGEPEDGLDVLAQPINRDGTITDDPIDAVGLGGGRYGIEASAAQEAAGTVFVFFIESADVAEYPYKVVTVAQDELIAWAYFDEDGELFAGPGVPAWLSYTDKTGSALTAPSILTPGAFPWLNITTIPPEDLAVGVGFTIEAPTGAYAEFFGGHPITSYAVPSVTPAPDAVIYGQLYGADGNSVPGARDLAFDFATGLFKRTTRGGLALTQGLDAIRQDCELSLQILLGEWFADVEIGFPMLQQVLVKSPNIPAIRSLIRTYLEARPGVSTVTKIDSNYDTSRRTLRVTWSANTDLGELTGAVTFAR